MKELLELFRMDFNAYIHGPMLLLALVGIGFIVGVLTGLFGVGGGFLVNPLLLVLLGIQETLVVGGSLCFTIGTGAAGMARHWRTKHIDFKAALFLALGAIPCVMLGKYLHMGLRNGLGEAHFAVVYRILYLIILLITAWVVFRAPVGTGKTQSLLQRLPVGPQVDLAGGELIRVSVPGILLVGGIIGLMKGLLGIGGGVLFVPLLLAVVGLQMHLTVGTSLGAVVVSSIFGTLLYGQSGEVNMLLVMSLLVGSAVGVQIGARLCHKLAAKRLQRYFIGVVLVTAIMVAADLLIKLVRG